MMTGLENMYMIEVPSQGVSGVMSLCAMAMAGQPKTRSCMLEAQALGPWDCSERYLQAELHALLFDAL